MSELCEKELAERLRRLELVERVARKVASTLDLDEVLRTTAQETRAALACYTVGIALVDGDVLRFHAVDTVYGFWDRARLADRPHGLKGESLFAWVVQNRRTLYAPDTAVDARFIPSPRLPLIRAEAVMPLIVGEQLVGVMNALGDRVNAFDAADIELLETIAAHVAAAVRNAQLHSETRHAVARLEALQHIGAEVNSQLDLSALLQTIADRAISLLGGDDGGVYLYDPDQDNLRLEAGAVPARVGMRLQRGEAASGWVLATGEPLLLRDYQQWFQGPPLFGDAVFRSVVSTPMNYRGERIGVMTVSHTREAGIFGEAEMRLLGLLAQQAAIAIVNARLIGEVREQAVQHEALYRKATRHLGQLQFIHQISRRLTADEAPDALLQDVVSQIHERFGYGFVSVAMQEGDCLVFKAAASDEPGFAARTVGLPMALDLNRVMTHVARTGATYRVDDARADPHFHPSFSQYTTDSELAAPLKAGEAVIGVLNVEAYGLAAFDESDVALIEALAAQMSAMIQNAQLHAETRRAVERLEALHHVGTEVTSQLDLSALLRTSVERAASLLGADDGGVYLYDAAQDDLRLEATMVRERVGRRLGRGEGASGQVLATGEPLVVADYQRWAQSATVFADAVLRSVVAVPLRYRDETMGVMTVADTRAANRFGDSDMRLLELFASQAVVAIVNARLMAEARSATAEAQHHHKKSMRHLEQLRLFHEVGHRLRAEGALADLLQAVAEQIQAAFGYPHVDIALLEDDELVFLAASGDNPEYAMFNRGYRRSLSIPGVVTHVVQEGQPYVVADAAKDPYFVTARGGFFSASELCVPLKAGERVIGVLNLESRHRDAFDESDVALANGLAAQIAATIQNAQLLEQVRREQSQLAQALDHVAGGVVTLDPAGRVLSLNASAAALLGVDAVPARGMAADELLEAHGNGATNFSRLAARAIALQESVSPGETLFAPRAGARADRLLAVSLAPMADARSGEVTSLVLGLWDVTASAQLERLRSELSSVLAHELRSPLARILLLAKDVEQAHAGKEERKNFQKVMAEVRLLGRVVEGILQASQIEAGRVVLDLAPVAVTPLVRQVLRQFEPEERFRMEIAPDTGLANADVVRLHVVLTNLVSNAAAYSPSHMPVSVRVVRDAKDAIRFSVTDGGEGIKPEEQERIFQRFARLRGGRERRASGTGLGLYIARGLVEAHGGRIWVDSMPGAGATFHFTVPAYDEEAHGPDLDH